jgi:AraC family transcriptional regulator
LSETCHRRREKLSSHAHERSTACLVLRGAFRERAGRLDVECGPATLVWRPAGMQHEDVFGDEGACCFNLEVAPELIEGKIEPAVDSARGAWAAARLALALRAAEGLESLDVEEGIVELVQALRERDTPPAPRHVRRAVELLDASATHRWSLSAVAREVGLHPMHLARAFRRARGESLGQFVRRRRVELASTLLARTDRSIADVALATGFADQPHLTRVFRRITRMTPARFRAVLRSFKT